MISRIRQHLLVVQNVFFTDSESRLRKKLESKLKRNPIVRILKILFYFFLFFYVSALFPGEEDRRNSFGDLYFSPLQVITPEEIQSLDSEKRIRIDEDSGIALRDEPKPPAVDAPVVVPTEVPTETIEVETGPKNLETKIREGEGLLKRYYSQFIEEKRIWEDREKGNIYNSRTESNDIRLLLWQKTHKDSETYIVRDSPLLYNLHIRLAKLYRESDKFAPALRHYLAAFRYHPLDLTEEFYRTGEWQKEDILGYDAAKAKEHANLFNELKLKETEFKKSKDDLHVLESNWIKSGKTLGSLAAEKEKQIQIIKSKENELQTAKQNYEDSLNSRYNEYLKKRREAESNELYAMATVVKKLEDDNKERLKIINKSGVAGKGIYVLFDYKRNTDFFAYELILERAYRVWNENPFVLGDIAEQYRQDGKKERAVDFYEKSLSELQKIQNPTEEDQTKINLTFLRLATINADLKRKVIAGNYYEKYFSSSPDSIEKTRVSYEMGVFFSEHIGDLDKSAKFLTYWLEKNSKDWNPSITEEPMFPELEAIAFYNLSKKDKQGKRISAEQNKLNLAYEQWKKIETKLVAEERVLKDIIEKKQKLKRDLLVTTEDDILSQYRLMDIKIEDQEAIIRVLETKRNKIPLVKILFRLGVLAETNRDYKKAMEFYDKVINEGGETEINLALKELERVKKILVTGNIIPPINESI